MIRKVGLISGVLMVLLMASVISNGSAFAATTQGTSTNLAVMQKACSVVRVHLSGSTSTITCLKHRPQGASRVSPNLYRDDGCSDPNSLNVWNYNYTSLLCFDGGGYLGVAIYQVNKVDYNNNYGNGAWIRWYQRGSGTFSVINSFSSKVFGNGTTNVEITQLCAGSTKTNYCPTF